MYMMRNEGHTAKVVGDFQGKKSSCRGRDHDPLCSRKVLYQLSYSSKADRLRGESTFRERSTRVNKMKMRSATQM